MMRAFSRTRITAAVATAAATALVVAPTASPTPPRLGAAQPTAVQLDLAASATPMGTASVAPLTVEPVAVTPPDPTQLRAARAAMQRLSPETSEAPEALAASAVVAPFNAASNTIDSVYEWAKGWVEYGVSLSQYVLQFIPLGYLIGDQVGIIYYNLVEPIADSVVYQLIDPIVNDPLNISSYVNGAIAVGQTTVAALVDTAVAEFYYFFGWLIPPLPPLPLAVTEPTEVTEVTEATDPAAVKVEEDAPVDGDVVDPALEGALPAPAAAPEAVVEQVEFVEAAKVPEPTDVLGPITEPATEPLTVTEPAQPDPEPTEPVEPVDPATDLAPVAGPTKDVANGVAAQGQVRSGSQAIVVRADSPGGPTRVDAQHPARAEASSSASTAPAEDAAPTSPSAPTAATTPSAPTSTTGTDTEASAAPAADTAP